MNKSINFQGCSIQKLCTILTVLIQMKYSSILVWTNFFILLLTKPKYKGAGALLIQFHINIFTMYNPEVPASMHSLSLLHTPLCFTTLLHSDLTLSGTAKQSQNFIRAEIIGVRNTRLWNTPCMPIQQLQKEN